MASVDADDLVRFGQLVRRYVDVVDGDVAGIDLLRQLRIALGDLYAMALHQPAPPRSERSGHLELVSNAKKGAVAASLERRLPSELYWSALLPRNYADVGDLGVKTLADALGTIYGWLAPGLGLLGKTGSDKELQQWWFEWEAYWGSPAVRCIAILHEVIVDLEMYARP